MLTQEEEKVHKSGHKKVEYKPKTCKTTDNDTFGRGEAEAMEASVVGLRELVENRHAEADRTV